MCACTHCDIHSARASVCPGVQTSVDAVTCDSANTLFALIQSLEDEFILDAKRTAESRSGLLSALRKLRKPKIENLSGQCTSVPFDATVQSFLTHRFDWSDTLPKGCPSDVVALSMYKDLLRTSPLCTRWVVSYCLLDMAHPSCHWWSWNGQDPLDAAEMRRLANAIVAHAIHQQLQLKIPHNVASRVPRQRMAADVLQTARTILIQSLYKRDNDGVCTLPCVIVATIPLFPDRAAIATTGQTEKAHRSILYFV